MRKLTLISLTILLLSLALATPTLAQPPKHWIETYKCTEPNVYERADVFEPGEAIYVNGTLNKPDADYKIYVISPHYGNWEQGTTTLEGLKEMGYTIYEVCTVHTDKKGKIGIIQIVPINGSYYLEYGYYDIFADCQDAGTKGKYEEVDELDAFDIIDTKKAGFHVIPEMPLGPIAMLLACFTAVLLKYRRPLSLRG